jgi:DNA-binding NarL/FixJ family response regulator
MKRLIVVADDSLIVEAIRIGLRESGEFNLLGSVVASTARAPEIVASGPEVVLVDDMERSFHAANLVRSIKAHAPTVSVIMLSLSMDPEWLDEIFDAGAAAVISKVTHPRSLGTLIRETIDGHVVRIPADAVRPIGKRVKSVAAGDHPDGVEVALTNRELEVLQLVANGSSNREIARNLWVTEQTVKFHLANVYRKLDVGNRTQASHFAHVNGLVDPPNSSVDS